MNVVPTGSKAAPLFRKLLEMFALLLLKERIAGEAFCVFSASRDVPVTDFESSFEVVPLVAAPQDSKAMPSSINEMLLCDVLSVSTSLCSNSSMSL